MCAMKFTTTRASHTFLTHLITIHTLSIYSKCSSFIGPHFRDLRPNQRKQSKKRLAWLILNYTPSICTENSNSVDVTGCVYVTVESRLLIV